MVARADPARAALAEVILRRDDIARRLEAAREAEERPSQFLYSARGRLDAAKAATADAQIELIVSGGTGALIRSLREIREDGEDAAADIEVARAAREKLRGAIKELKMALDLAEARVERAIGAVMAGAVGGFLAEVEALETELAAKRAVLFGFLCSRLPPDAADYAKLSMMARSESFAAPDRNHPALAPWISAYEALLHDASAALPEG